MNVTSPYDDVTPESIKTRMLAEVEVAGEDIDIREGSYTNTLVSEAAYELYRLYQLLPGVLDAVFPDENAGEYIDKNAAQIGMTRQSGEKATVTVTFTGEDGTEIPAETALYATQSGFQFVTRESIAISGGSATATAIAAEVGAKYNVRAGEINALYTNVAGVHSVSNAEAATGGVDAESDADLYARYHARRTMPATSGNPSHYITWALETEGVAFANCVPIWDGPGTVKVIVAGSGREPVDENVRSECAQYIETQRPVGAAVTVVSTAARKIPMTARVTLVDGYSTADVTDQLTQAVTALLERQEFGVAVTIPYSRFLGCLLQCAGVADYSSFSVDGGTAAVTLAAEDAAGVGTVTVQ